MNERALQRHLKKAQLLQRIEQQRVQLSNECQNWLDSTQTLDNSWQRARRHPLLVSAGVALVAVYALRHPRRLLRKGQWALFALRGIDYASQILKKSSF